MCNNVGAAYHPLSRHARPQLPRPLHESVMSHGSTCAGKQDKPCRTAMSRFQLDMYLMFVGHIVWMDDARQSKHLSRRRTQQNGAHCEQGRRHATHMWSITMAKHSILGVGKATRDRIARPDPHLGLPRLLDDRQGPGRLGCHRHVLCERQKCVCCFVLSGARQRCFMSTSRRLATHHARRTHHGQACRPDCSTQHRRQLSRHGLGRGPHAHAPISTTIGRVRRTSCTSVTSVGTT